MMDSPDLVKKTATPIAAAADATPSDSPPVQESPFFSYVNNLSPIKPVKASHLPQAFPCLNSPPLVFTSPHLNSHREAIFLKRARFSQSPSVESSQNQNGGKSFADDSFVSKKLSCLLPVEFITGSQENCDVKDHGNSEPCSSSGCIDEYLADPLEIECLILGHPTSNDVEQSKDAPDSSTGLSGSKETLSNSDEEIGAAEKVRVDLSLDNLQENPISNVEQVKDCVEQKDLTCPSKENLSVQSSMSVELAFEKQQSADSFPQVVRDSQDSEGNIDASSYVSSEIMVADNSEVSKKRCSALRRCLQFEEAAPNTSGNTSLHAAHIVIHPKSLIPTPQSEHLEISHGTLNVNVDKRRMIKLTQPITSSFYPRCIGNPLSAGSKPSGIGLHLNSIVHTVSPVNCTAPTRMRLAEDSMNIEGSKSASKISFIVLENTKRCSISSNSADLVVGLENNASTVATSESLSTMTPYNLLKHIEGTEIVDDDKKLNSECSDSFEESNQSSPKKKKKKTSSTSDNDGCKRCNCKKSKCLKLYCECFAAGIYCSEPCACQGCFNTPEHEDTVLETRQQIESRNPLAFAPKVIQQGTEIPAENRDVGNLVTPSSARHKRGCNCKKSMCRKKYCECYQANVGCCAGCRCEGCENVYGRKEDFNAKGHDFRNEMVSNRSIGENSDGRFDEKLELVAKTRDLNDLRHFTPLTPSLQRSDPGKDTAKSLLPSRKYVPSPGCDVSLSSSAKSTDSPTNPENSDVIMERRRRKAYILSGSSLLLRTSPITPMTQLSETKCHDSDGGLYDIMEDETPEVLKDTCTPIKSVKVSSPNQKRVSPPPSHAQEHRSSSIGSMRSGRKFILKAVPSFPPLTPCVDSKGGSSSSSNNNTASDHGTTESNI